MSLEQNNIPYIEYGKQAEKVYDIANVICFFGMFIICLFLGIFLNFNTGVFATFGISLLFLFTLIAGKRTGKRNTCAIIMAVIFNFLYAPYMLVIYGVYSQSIFFSLLIGIIYTLLLIEYKTSVVLSVAELVFYGVCLFIIIDKGDNSILYGSLFANRIAYCFSFLSFLFVVISACMAVRIRKQMIYEEKSKADKLYVEVLAEQASKDMFLLNVSHEIRTPMNAIVGNSNLLLDESINDNVREYTNKILNSCDAMLLILDELMELAKLDEDTIAIEKKQYDFREIISGIVNMISVKLLESNLRFEVKINPLISRFLFGDGIKIRHIIIYLLNNGIHYIKNGYIGLDVDYLENDNDEIILSFLVKYIGTGISENDILHIFENDYKYEGLNDDFAAGVSLCRKVVEKMFGTIKVNIIQSQGTEFVISIPQIEVKGDTIGQVLPDINNENYSVDFGKRNDEIEIPGVNILIVDDNYTNLDVALALFKKYKANIYTASSGREAIRMLEDNSINIIFLDYMMPEMNGIDTLKIIRKIKNGNYSKTPVIALSANVVSGARDTFINAGFDDFLPKPININRLNKIIRKYVINAEIISNKNEDEFV